MDVVQIDLRYLICESSLKNFVTPSLAGCLEELQASPEPCPGGETISRNCKPHYLCNPRASHWPAYLSYDLVSGCIFFFTCCCSTRRLL